MREMNMADAKAHKGASGAQLLGAALIILGSADFVVAEIPRLLAPDSPQVESFNPPPIKVNNRAVAVYDSVFDLLIVAGGILLMKGDAKRR